MWLAYQWKLVIAAGLASIVMIHLGVLDANQHWWQLESFQRTLEVLGVGRPVSDRPHNWLAILGSVFFVVAAVLTLWTAWRVVFVEQRQYSRLWRLADHTIVCGFGEKGRYVTTALAEAPAGGGEVVVIERQGGHPGIEQRRRDGLLTLVGDATDPDVLRLAGVERASYLLALGSSDDTNAEIATQAAKLSEDRRHGRLTCIMHLDDPTLFHLIRERELAGSSEPSFRLQCFNVHETGARALLDAHPPTAVGGGAPHVVIVGFGRLGQRLLLEIGRRWWFDRPDGGRVVVTVVDPAASARLSMLTMRHAALRDTMDLRPLDVAVQSAEFEEGRFLSSDVGAIYVCVPEPANAITAGLALRTRLRGRRIPIVVRVARAEGLTALVQEAAEGDARSTLHLFPLVPATCGTEIVTRTTVELLARAFHGDYVRDAVAKGRSASTEPSLRAWSELTDVLRESNRQRADDVHRQLSALGYELLPLMDWTVVPPAFSADEVERLAQVEHDRWLRQYLRQGWRRGAARDANARTHPDLVEWEGLSEDSRDKNRAAARSLPTQLARMGFQIARRAE